MGVKNIVEFLRIFVQYILIGVQICLLCLLFIFIIIPCGIIDYFMQPKSTNCKVCDSKLVECGYPDEIGFQRTKCPRCN